MNAQVQKPSKLHINGDKNVIFKLSFELTGDKQDVAEKNV